MTLKTTYLVVMVIALALFLITSVLVNNGRTASPKTIAELSRILLMENSDANKDESSSSDEDGSSTEIATFGTGCFWCTEAVFEELDGVVSVTSGYSGGSTDNPTYRDVCTGSTGHAEVVQITYDPKQVSFGRLLQAFWLSHDPTTLNRQGNDVGTQYRSVIFYHSENQKELAEQFRLMLNESNAFGKPVVTEISKFEKFFVAENYHQDYFAANGHAPYCQFIIKPKLKKFKTAFDEVQN